MPTRITPFNNYKISPYYKNKNVIHNVQRRNLTPVEKIPEKRRYTRCLIGASVGSAITAVIIIAALLPPLIVILTRSSASATTTSSITNTDQNSSVSYYNGTTISSVTSILPSSISVNTVSTVSAVTGSTFAYPCTPGITSSSSMVSYYGAETVFICCSTDLINITIIIIVQKTVNATYSGVANNFWTGVLNTAYIDNGLQIEYTWTINSGQTVQAVGGLYYVEAQFHLFGTNQTTNTDTYQVITTNVNGSISTISGTF